MALDKLTSDMITVGAVNAAAIADGTVVAAEIADDAIVTAKIANSAITDAKIAAVAATKLSGTIADARFPSTLPAASGVNLTALNATQLTSGTIPIARIANSTITGGKIGNTTITGGNLVNGTITATQIAGGAVTSTQILDGTIVDGDISSATISGGKLQNGTITDTQMSNMSATKLTSGTLPMARLSGTLPALNGSALTNLPAPSTTIYDLHFTAGFNASGDQMAKENAIVGTYGEMVMARSGTFVGAAGYCDTFSGPGYTQLDILKNGTSVYSTKPSFGSSGMGAGGGAYGAPVYSVTSFAVNDRITFRVHANANGNSQGIRFVVKCTV